MKDEKTNHWQPPPDNGRDNSAERMSWVSDIVSMGEQYNATLSSSKDIVRAIEMISGRNNKLPNQSRSDVSFNREKRALREVVANIADIRSVDAYSSDNPAYQTFLAMLNKVGRAVWYE